MHFSFWSPVASVRLPSAVLRARSHLLSLKQVETLNNLFEKSNVNWVLRNYLLLHIYNFVSHQNSPHTIEASWYPECSQHFLLSVHCTTAWGFFLADWPRPWPHPASMNTWQIFPAWVCTCPNFPFLIRTPVIVLGPTLIQNDLILTWLHL